MTDLKVLVTNSKSLENNALFEKTMTVKEVGEILEVSKDTVLNCIKRIMPTKLQHGVTTVLNEQEVACISKELKSNKAVTDRLTVEVCSTVKNTTTKLEVIANYKKATEQLIIMLDNENTELKQKIAALAPQAQIASDFIDRKHLTNFRDSANVLGITQKDFMQILFPKYIYKNSIGEYRCYSQFSEYFDLRPFQKGSERTGQQLMLNLNGLEYFKKITKGDVA